MMTTAGLLAPTLLLRALLRLMPAQVLAPLDAWSLRLAKRRAARRRELAVRNAL
ncbi:MAG TPA: hypothetical protein VLJ86_03395 [Ramlibacter sp.]|nr:hypothetical protein [Ramlibacter sp.]